MSRQWGWSFGGGDADGGPSPSAARPPGSAPARPVAAPVTARAGGPAAPSAACTGAAPGRGGVKPSGGAARSANPGGTAKPAAGAAGVAGAQPLRVQTTSAVADTPRREAGEAATDAELSTPSREADAQAGDAGVADAESPGGCASPTSDCDDDLDELLANAQSVMAAAEAATARLLEQRDRLQLGDARTPQSDEDEYRTRRVL